jgi:hypothetical protein
VSTTTFESMQDRPVESEPAAPEYSQPIVLSAFECEAMDETMLEAA